MTRNRVLRMIAALAAALTVLAACAACGGNVSPTPSGSPGVSVSGRSDDPSAPSTSVLPTEPGASAQPAIPTTTPSEDSPAPSHGEPSALPTEPGASVQPSEPDVPATPSAKPGNPDIVPPVLDTGNVPRSIVQGVPTTLPKVIATDNADGDLTDKVKVGFYQLKKDKKTVNKTIFKDRQQTEPIELSVSSVLLKDYLLTFSVTDAAGNTATASVSVTVEEDKEGGTLTLDPAFGGETVAAAAGEMVRLPQAIAIDQPSGKDISDRVTIDVYALNGNAVLYTFRGEVADWQVVLPAGEYIAKYSVKDAAGNEFNDHPEVRVSVSAGPAVNLIAQKDLFAVNGTEGISWWNRYGELCFGHTPAFGSAADTVGWALKSGKIYEQYAGITFNADPPGSNGQMFYSLSARGSRDRDSFPGDTTGLWPDYLFLRIEKKQIVSRVERTTDAAMETVRAYRGELLDGKDHTLYVQWKNVGESASAADAAIEICGWVDKTPAGGREDASFIFRAVPGAKTGEGVLEAATFRSLWEESGAGWLCMDTYETASPHEKDYMRIKGVAVYEKDETAFAADICPPQISPKVSSGIVAVGKKVSLFPAAADGGEEVLVTVLSENGDAAEVADGGVIPLVPGTYTAYYTATDEAGNVGHAERVFVAANEDKTPPELTLASEEKLFGTAGEAVSLPKATATDNLDGNVSGKITVKITGPEKKEGIKPGASVTLHAAGVYTALYEVRDSYGNAARKRITIGISAAAEGEQKLLAEPVTKNEGSLGFAASQYVYEEKVSVRMTIQSLQGVVMFNLRGAVGNADWPQGLVLRLTDTGQCTVSAKGHDEAVFASCDLSPERYIGKSVVLSYRVKDVKVGGVEYLQIRVWLDDEELAFYATEKAQTDLVSGEGGVYRKKADFTGEQADNVYASPVWIAVYRATVTIEEITFSSGN